MILFSSFTHVYVLMLFLYLGLCCGLIFFVSCRLLNQLKVFILTKNKIKKESCDESKLDNSKSESDNATKSLLESSSLLNYNNKQNREVKNNLTSDLINDLKQNNLVEEFIELPDTNFEVLSSTNSEDIVTSGKEIAESSNYPVKTSNLVSSNTIQKSISLPLKDSKKSKKNKHNKKLLNIKKSKKEKPKKQKLSNFKKVKNKLQLTFKEFGNFLNKVKVPLVKVSEIIIKICLIFALLVGSYLINLHLNFGEIRFMFIIIFIVSFFMAKSLLNLLAFYFTNFYNYFRKKLSKHH